ncbi:hypothetical protein TNCV_675421 [Trichonephila clavipes]|nr:hypothetical protein TNCV_675421 [Trichonephila clavipes]
MITSIRTDKTQSHLTYDTAFSEVLLLLLAEGSLVVRASDSRPEGLGSMPDAPKYLLSTHEPFSVHFLGQHFGDKLLVTDWRKIHGDREYCLGAMLFEPATFRFKVHVFDDLDDTNSYSGQSLRAFIPVFCCLQLAE